jgi:hypothetical protein
MALPLIGAFVREREASAVAVEDVIPRLPIRGRRAGGHPSRHA